MKREKGSKMSDLKENLLSWTEEFGRFNAPTWDALPDIDLYMDQVITYMERQLSVFAKKQDDKRSVPSITPSMINNYVKNEMIPRPVQKKYTREHLAYLLAICHLKQVLPLSDIAGIFRHQAENSTISELFNLFKGIQEETLHLVSERVRDTVNTAASDESEISFNDSMRLLALKLSMEANASRIAAEFILSRLDMPQAAPSQEKEKPKSPEKG